LEECKKKKKKRGKKRGKMGNGKGKKAVKILSSSPGRRGEVRINVAMADPYIYLHR